jgi:XTP/dITP diphosphohydrolase
MDKKNNPLSQPDPHREEKLKAFDRLLTIMDELRENCPWDQKQTIQSLRYLTIEETYELSDSIIENNFSEIKKELGDVLLHILFYSRIASETNQFDIADVINQQCEKLITRHPHVYGDAKAKDEEEVRKNWEKIKLQEGNKSTLSGVPKSLPALVKSMRIQEKVRGAGFDWDNKQQVWAKVEEELQELKEEFVNPEKIDEQKAESELGDLLFSIINFARFLKINPEDALEKTNKKFIQRFQCMEKLIQEDKKILNEMTLAEMDQYWEKAKKIL